MADGRASELEDMSTETPKTASQREEK